MTRALDPSAAGIVEDHLARISAALGPRDTVHDDVVDEVRDCLLTAIEQRVAGGMSPDAATRAAVRDYGDLAQVAPAVGADVTATRARGSALALLRSGPAVAVVWTAALLTTSAATPSPWRAAMAWFGPAVIVTIACALTAYGTASRLGPVRPRLPRAAAVTATAACAVIDLAALAYVAVLALTGAEERWAILLAAATVSAVRLLVIGRRAVPLPSRPAA